MNLLRRKERWQHRRAFLALVPALVFLLLPLAASWPGLVIRADVALLHDPSTLSFAPFDISAAPETPGCVVVVRLSSHLRPRQLGIEIEKESSPCNDELVWEAALQHAAATFTFEPRGSALPVAALAVLAAVVPLLLALPSSRKANLALVATATGVASVAVTLELVGLCLLNNDTRRWRSNTLRKVYFATTKWGPAQPFEAVGLTLAACLVPILYESLMRSYNAFRATRMVANRDDSTVEAGETTMAASSLQMGRKKSQETGSFGMRSFDGPRSVAESSMRDGETAGFTRDGWEHGDNRQSWDGTLFSGAASELSQPFQPPTTPAGSVAMTRARMGSIPARLDESVETTAMWPAGQDEREGWRKY